MKVILNFLFGKFPKIFNKGGAVQHDLADRSWNHWQKRYKESCEYNWKLHKGKRLQKKPQKSF